MATKTKSKPAAKKAVKKVAKKAAPKKAVKKVAKKAAPKAISPAKKAMTKSQVVALIADHVELAKKQVGNVIDALEHVIAAHVKKGAVGQFKLNGLLNIKAVKKPARKARKGVNPFTGQEIMIKAKPAYRSIRVTALKRLKEMAEK